MTGARSFDDHAVGSRAALDHVITAADVARFVALTGDDNPVHVDDAYAAEIGVGRRVVHGMLTASYVSTVIGTLLPGPGALWLSEQMNFRAPVRIGDALHVEVTVRQVSPATRVLVLDVRVTNQDHRVVLDGEARVQVLERVANMQEQHQDPKVAVVTGSGRGIGAAIARRLAADGLDVVVSYVQDLDSATTVVSDIIGAGGTATAFQADVADPEGAAALIDHAARTYGPVDVLVNNAGGPTDPRSLAETTWDHVERHLAAHLRSSFHCVQAALPSMLDRHVGRIVNITSQAAYDVPPPKMTGYVIAKAALAAYTRCLALETGPHGITANAVAPGMVATDLVADVPARTKLTLAAQAPLRRLATPNDVADIVSFLAGPTGGYVTGQTVHLSGGQVMA